MNKQKNTASAVFITFLITTVLYVGAYVFVPQTSTFLTNLKSITSGFLKNGDVNLDEIQNLVNKNYFKDVDEAKLTESAMKGYVAGLGDPYSQYHTPEEYKDVLSDLNGNYKGIGITATVMDGEIVIAVVHKGGPADKAGMKKGDIIIKVDDTEVNGDSYNEAVTLMRGTNDTDDKVKVTVKRGEETLTKDLVREEITTQTVTYEIMKDDIGYVAVSTFGENTDEDFRVGVNNLINQGAKSLIIDLRDNPGGMLTTVVDMADFLLPEGKILTIEGKNTPKQEFKSEKGEINLPIYVLINGSSASASEVLAGALRDHKKATLIGETTFGKGLVQTMFELKNGGALRLTTAQYYTPSGVCIDKTGIKPDVEVKMELEKSLALYTPEEDIQLQKAIELAGDVK